MVMHFLSLGDARLSGRTPYAYVRANDISHWMRQGEDTVDVLGRALRLLAVVVQDGGTNTITALAGKAGLPVSTAHRLARTIADAGYLTSVSRGRFLPGPAFRSAASAIGPLDGIVPLARPILARLARRLGAVVHLGVLQDDMVTYLLKTGPQSGALFTREAMQLEAYCSGIGKVLLAQLPPEVLDDYLSNGPFIALTPGTITDPAGIRAELQKVAREGFARDNFEVAPDLNCLAVPLVWPDGQIRAAISVSRISPTRNWSIPDNWLAWMRASADDVSQTLVERFGYSGANPS
jgi:IclR family acetate operon transcriptional repressor